MTLESRIEALTALDSRLASKVLEACEHRDDGNYLMDNRLYEKGYFKEMFSMEPPVFIGTHIVADEYFVNSYLILQEDLKNVAGETYTNSVLRRTVSARHRFWNAEDVKVFEERCIKEFLR